ncbi:hypothetical protein UMNF18_3970 [Escherichia coli UMNF18]|nr:hypothetical protein UMNF18_3970 [Escherichia coli UMNF18]EGX15715.1 hypothetical protein ECSTECS1191_4105 [Escherichia coli STEC_S1191]EII44185.1 hypothetical protein EC23916_0920 [Escherichia coli 2.3916]
MGWRSLFRAVFPGKSTRGAGCVAFQAMPEMNFFAHFYPEYGKKCSPAAGP